MPHADAVRPETRRNFVINYRDCLTYRRQAVGQRSTPVHRSHPALEPTMNGGYRLTERSAMPHNPCPPRGGLRKLFGEHGVSVTDE